MCRSKPAKGNSKKQEKAPSTKWVQADDGDTSEGSESELPMYRVACYCSSNVIINNKKGKMEVDTGAAVTVMSERVKGSAVPKHEPGEVVEVEDVHRGSDGSVGGDNSTSEVWRSTLHHESNCGSWKWSLLTWS